ncbi:MAG: ABC transporter ATP-binding protein, partial [Acidobacteria bacterium]|nr:ABC transporter ATP-binding protein [Acidobacteriota bacterium]
LDEPTNDLDAETLDLLEERIGEFDGTLLLVSHDRAFLDNVVSSTLVMEGGGKVGEYAGGYEDWLLQRPKPSEAKPQPSRPEKEAKGKPAGKESGGQRKLTYRENKDLEALPGRIEALEAEQKELHDAFADPEFFATRGPEGAVEAHRRLAEIEEELTSAYQRWEELEAVAEG